MKGLRNLLLLFCIGLGEWVNAQELSDTPRWVSVIKDYTEDGILDTLKIEDLEGYVENIEFINGANKKIYNFYKFNDYYSFLDFIAVSEDLLPHKSLLDTVRFLLLELEIPINKPSSAYYFYRSLHLAPTFTPQSQYYYKIIRPNRSWIKGELDTSFLYTQLVKLDTFFNINYANEDKFGWIRYKGLLHQRYSYEYRYDTLKLEEGLIIKTEHGIVIMNDTSFKWLYHTGCDLFGCQNYYRPKCIEKIHYHNGHLYVYHTVGRSNPKATYNLAIINLQSGAIGDIDLVTVYEDKFKDKITFLQSIFKVKFKKNKIQFNYKDSRRTLPEGISWEVKYKTLEKEFIRTLK